MGIHSKQHGHHHHDHNHHGHDHHHVHSSDRGIKIAVGLNLSFAVIELVGGYLTQSMAVTSDALHDFGDGLALIIAFVLHRFSLRAGNKHFSYGFKRLSLFSATITGGFLVAGSIVVLFESVVRVWEPVLPHTNGMMALAVLGVLVNGAAAKLLKHGHSHNEKMMSWHMIEDLLGWVLVLIGGLVIQLTGWARIDPLLSIFISLFIMRGVWRQMSETLVLFMQRAPREIDVHAIEGAIAAVSSVKSVHDLHIWSLDGSQHVITCHVVTGQDLALMQTEKIKSDVRNAIRPFGAMHATIEVECEGQDCPKLACVSSDEVKS
jgi:cobalt-zinc-cadmium efflux system protein